MFKIMRILYNLNKLDVIVVSVIVIIFGFLITIDYPLDQSEHELVAWSQKATNKDAKGRIIKNPELAERGHLNLFCGYYAVPNLSKYKNMSNITRPYKNKISETTKILDMIQKFSFASGGNAVDTTANLVATESEIAGCQD